MSRACLLLGLALCACASRRPAVPENASIVVKPIGNGVPVSIPTTGPLSSDAMTSTAQVLASSIGRVRGLLDVEDPMQRAVGEIAVELNDQAVADLDLALRIAKRTSGAVDKPLVERASSSATSLKVLLATPPPQKFFVKTEITSSLTDRQLHFMNPRDFRAKKQTWSSYTFGSEMHIGSYVFRVFPCGGTEAGYIEQVLVLSDPTKTSLQPMCRE